MGLEPGTRLGVYEILSLIGKGGMGEVYRATDTRLHRDVALKVSTEVLSQRFHAEGRAIAALNHPNICTLHDVGDNYLVMELVEGPTLADRIGEGPIPLGEALKIAEQIEAALAAAHERGIVHRDLKPANIKVRPDGSVKVLDFGLAKLGGPESPVDLNLSPTMSLHATQAGVILGTAAYMSPEQARGQLVDTRADIWAFGVVLYEMLTGKRLFAGQTLTDTVAAVIERDVDFKPVPELVRPLLHACLQKDPRRRLQDIRDARLLLSGPHATPHAAEVWPWARWTPAIVALLIAGVAAVMYLRQPAVLTPPLVRFPLSPEPKLVSGNDFYMTMSPDGRQMAYTALDQNGGRFIWVRSLDTLQPRMLAGTFGARSLFWSPDSRFVAFADGNRLMKVDAAGSTPPVTITQIEAAVGIGSWSRDDVIVFGGRGPGQGGIRRVAAAGGTPTLVTTLRPDQQAHSYPMFLPDGKHFIYLALSNKPEVRGLYTASIDMMPSDQPTDRLLAVQYGAFYMPPQSGGSGHLLFQREQTLMAQKFEPASLTLSGEPIPIAEQLGAAGSSGYFSASRGVLAYRVGGGGGRRLTWFDRNGKAVATTGPIGSFVDVALSPDGTRVATFQDNAQGDVWVTDVAREATMRLTFGADAERTPVWSRDGKQIAYSGPQGVYRKSADGTGEPELLLKQEFTAPVDWSPDGRYLLIRVGDGAGNGDLSLLPLVGDRKPISVLATPFDENSARFSADGRWIVYRSTQTGSSEIYVRPFTPPGAPGGGITGQWMISNGGGFQPRWNANGREILYLTPNGRLMSVSVTTTNTAFVAEAPKVLFEMPVYGGGNGSTTSNRWDVNRDGTKFIVNATVVERNDSPVVIVENWQQLLKP